MMPLPPLFVQAEDPTKIKARLPVFRTNFDYGVEGYPRILDEYRKGKIQGMGDFIEQHRKEPSPIKMLREKRKRRKKKVAGILEDTAYQAQSNSVKEIDRQHIPDDDIRKYRTVPSGERWRMTQEHQDAIYDNLALPEDRDYGSARTPVSALSDRNLVMHYDFIAHDDYGAIRHKHPMYKTRKLNELRVEMENRGLHFEEVGPGEKVKPGQHEAFNDLRGSRRYFYWREADMLDQPRKEVEFTPAHETPKKSAAKPPLSITAKDTSVMYNSYYEEAADYWAEAPGKTLSEKAAVKDYVDYVSQVSAPEERKNA